MKIKIFKALYKRVNNERYYPCYVFFLSAFILFFQLEGSIGNWDESCYSEIAREGGVINNNWIDLNYLGKPWFEKPPLVIWFTMVSYKIFGISEFATWFFPVVFGIFGVLGIYYLSKLLFNSKIGLFSSLVILSTPHYLLLARSNMMDIFIFTFSIFSFLFLIKSKYNQKYLLLSGLLLGLSFMSKSIISILIIFPAFTYYIIFINKFGILRNKYLNLSIILFIIIVVPWHLIMIYKYQWEFLDVYVGFHLIGRYTNDVVFSGGSGDIFHYIKVIILRSGSWWLVYLAILPIVFCNIKNKTKHKELLLLLIWGIFIILFFTSSVTKLHHYILPFYISMSILISYSLYDLYKRRSSYLLFPLALVFINISDSIILKSLDFGETMIVFPLILHKIFNNSINFLFIITILIFIVILYNFILKNRIIATKLSIFVIFLFSFLLPIKADRAPLAKEIGRITENKGIEMIYYYDCCDEDIERSLAFYNYPIKIVEIRTISNIKEDDNSKMYCLINKSSYKQTKKTDYNFFPCKISN